VELKEVRLRDGYYVMDPEKAVELVDENTICVAAILGSTLNGEFEDVKLLNDLLIKKNSETGLVSFFFFLIFSSNLDSSLMKFKKVNLLCACNCA
jgi:Pyridoxal-dependent decarboxylase conserved domain